MIRDLNTPGVHTPSSCHYKPGTPAPPRKPQDRSDGSIGWAGDFGFPIGERDSPHLLAIYNVFAAQGVKLVELIYSGPGVMRWISRGRWLPRSAMPKEIADAHHNHVHVALDVGEVLTWSGAQLHPVAEVPIPPPVITEFPEEQMQRIYQVVPKLDKDGNGYVIFQVPPERAHSFTPQGSYPPADGYWKLPKLGKQERDGKLVVTITEGPPNGRVEFEFWVL